MNPFTQVVLTLGLILPIHGYAKSVEMDPLFYGNKTTNWMKNGFGLRLKQSLKRQRDGAFSIELSKSDQKCTVCNAVQFDLTAASDTQNVLPANAYFEVESIEYLNDDYWQHLQASKECWKDNVDRKHEPYLLVKAKFDDQEYVMRVEVNSSWKSESGKCRYRESLGMNDIFMLFKGYVDVSELLGLYPTFTGWSE